MLFVLLFALFITELNGQFLNCGWIGGLDCSKYQSGSECGSDGVTYQNRCNFAKAQCVNKQLYIQSDGACPATRSSAATVPKTSTPVPTTTRATTTPTSKPTTTMSNTCIKTLNEACPSVFQPVCGSDDKIYPNMCYATKAQCHDPNLRFTNDGPCFAKYTYAKRAAAATSATPTS